MKVKKLAGLSLERMQEVPRRFAGSFENLIAMPWFHRTGTLIQPLAKAMARMTKGVDMPKMMM